MHFQPYYRGLSRLWHLKYDQLLLEGILDLQKKYVDGVEKASTLVRFHPESESELK